MKFTGCHGWRGETVCVCVCVCVGGGGGGGAGREDRGDDETEMYKWRMRDNMK